MTGGFIKHGPPFDPTWASPEEIFQNTPPSRQPDHWGRVVPPGQTISVHKGGMMAPGADPVLRVYLDDHPLPDLLAISHGSGQRLDLGIRPTANNNFIITEVPPQGLTARLKHVVNTPKAD